jgi:hypothetical protein
LERLSTTVDQIMNNKKQPLFTRITTVLFSAAVALILSCSQGSNEKADAKDRLTDYISTSFSIRDVNDREKLAAFLTGGAKNRLLAWSEEQFRSAFLDSKREFVKLAIREIKSVSDERTDITYELTYIDQGRGPDAKVTTKRMCELTRVDGKWMIREVKNIKELIEYTNETSIVY